VQQLGECKEIRSLLHWLPAGKCDPIEVVLFMSALNQAGDLADSAFFSYKGVGIGIPATTASESATLEIQNCPNARAIHAAPANETMHQHSILHGLGDYRACFHLIRLFCRSMRACSAAFLAPMTQMD
jgi:hypothetical protein